MQATKFRDQSHARLYSTWAELPTWRALSLTARVLLVEILMRYRPGENGRLQWPVRRAGNLLGVSKDTAGRALVELERNGWLSVTKLAGFGGAHDAARYRLTMFDCPETGQLATHAYKFMAGERLATDRKTRAAKPGKKGGDGVPLARLYGPMGRTPQAQGKDASGLESASFARLSIFRKPCNHKSLPREIEAHGPGPEIRFDTAIDIIASPSLAAALRRMKDRP